MDFLQGKAREVAEGVVAAEQARRRHLVIALSGAHAYGFPSPDSDLDLKAIHIAPTERLLGLGGSRDAFDRLEFVDGVEIDYTSNELYGVVKSIVAGNGNYIERVLGALICHTSPEHDELRALIPGVLSTRVHRHYRGFAHSQLQRFLKAEQPTAKKILYVLRTALTGVHLLRTGELRVDLTTTADEYGFSDAHTLIQAKREGEKTVLSDRERQAWLPRMDELFGMLDRAAEESVLPGEPASIEPINQWLLSVRRRYFQ